MGPIAELCSLLAFARPAEHWSGARRPFGARGVVPGRAIKTEESLDSVAACGNAGIEGFIPIFGICLSKLKLMLSELV